MFDKLRDSLSSFRDDVEETAEEAADEADDAPDAGTDADSDTPEAESATDGEAEGDADGEADAETGGRGIGERAKLFATGKAVLDPDDLDGPLEELEMALLAGDVEMGTAEALTDRVREELVDTTRTRGTSVADLVEEALRSALVDVMSAGEFDLEACIDAAQPAVVVFTGVNGVGKTTTIAKLARRLEARGYSVVLANGDTYRAGANEQLAEHAENLGLELISHEQGSDPAAVIYDAVEYAEANGVDVVLGDTAGRLHTSDDLMAQLEKIDRVVDPDATLFVDEAVAGQDAVNRAREFHDAAPIDGSVLTKADADTSGGAAISIAHVTDRPILFLGTGQGYDDLEAFDPEAMADRLLGE
ncbi:MAG: signal recognition particle-docking protein FtsY [Halobacteriaceae archaeon]